MMTPFRLARYICVTAGMFLMIACGLFLIFLITQMIYGAFMSDPVYPRGINMQAMELMAKGLTHAFVSLGLGALCGFVFGAYLCRPNNVLLWFIGNEEPSVQPVVPTQGVAAFESSVSTSAPEDYSDYAPKQ